MRKLLEVSLLNRCLREGITQVDVLETQVRSVCQETVLTEKPCMYHHTADVGYCCSCSQECQAFRISWWRAIPRIDLPLALIALSIVVIVNLTTDLIHENLQRSRSPCKEALIPKPPIRLPKLYHTSSNQTLKSSWLWSDHVTLPFSSFTFL